ncbi:hypothetical protein D9M72_585740 [compost metagenome]
MQAEAFQRLGADHLYQVAGQFADPPRLLRVLRVVAQQVGVFLDEGAAAAGGLHYGLGAGLDRRPPGVDIVPGGVQPFLLGIQVVVHGAAAARPRRRGEADAETIQHPRGGGIGVG